MQNVLQISGILVRYRISLQTNSQWLCKKGNQRHLTIYNISRNSFASVHLGKLGTRKLTTNIPKLSYFSLKTLSLLRNYYTKSNCTSHYVCQFNCGRDQEKKMGNEVFSIQRSFKNCVEQSTSVVELHGSNADHDREGFIIPLGELRISFPKFHGPAFSHPSDVPIKVLEIDGSYNKYTWWDLGQHTVKNLWLTAFIVLEKLNWLIKYLPSRIYNYELNLFIRYALDKKVAMDVELHRVIDNHHSYNFHNNHRDKLHLNDPSMLLYGAIMDVLVIQSLIPSVHSKALEKNQNSDKQRMKKPKSGNELRKVTDVIPKNPDGTHTCPKCKKDFKPQGITHHVKSCDPQWYRENIKK